MKKMIPIILLAFLSLQAAAQDSVVNISTDTATLPLAAPSVVTGDTMMVYNQLAINTDSVDTIRNSKDLVYLKNLDSLLRAAKRYELDQDKKPVRGAGILYVLAVILSSSITLVLFCGIGVALIVFLLYKLFLTDGIFERRSATMNMAEEASTEDIAHSVADYYALIDRAIAAGNYRLAVRYLFLQSLQQLSDDKLIVVSPDKTNFQYLFELKNSTIRNKFASLTLHYEYVWYGRFDLTETTFDTIHDSFKKFMQQL